METYAFANQIGGVGKTTVTLSLAAALASQKLSALPIDLDPQASATKVLGVEVEERHTVADVLLEPERFILRGVVVRAAWGFDLAAGGNRAGVPGVAARAGGADLVWQPLLPKRAVLQDATRRGVPVGELGRRAGRELGDAFATLARRMKVARVAA